MIEVKNLTKNYGDVVAVNDISFTVEAGKIYGFLGPNGAGKSTTMNIITGCLSASSGTVTVDGHDIFDDPIGAKKCIGYLPEIPPLYTDMTPLEFLTFVGRAKGLKKQELSSAVVSVMEKTDIFDVRSRLIKNLSKGYKQRVGIAQAILGNPKVIILDEPTVGLDPIQIVEIRSLIRELSKEHTVILSSHILPEVSEICDEILIISNGKLVASDTAENLIKKFNPETVTELVISGDVEACANALAAIDEISKIEIDDAAEDGTVKLFLHIPSNEDIRQKVAEKIVESGARMLSMNTVKASLEDIFLEVTSENIGVLTREAETAEQSAEESTENGTEETAEACTEENEEKEDEEA